MSQTSLEQGGQPTDLARVSAADPKPGPRRVTTSPAAHAADIPEDQRDPYDAPDYNRAKPIAPDFGTMEVPFDNDTWPGDALLDKATRRWSRDPAPDGLPEDCPHPLRLVTAPVTGPVIDAAEHIWPELGRHAPLPARGKVHRRSKQLSAASSAPPPIAPVIVHASAHVLPVAHSREEAQAHDSPRTWQQRLATALIVTPIALATMVAVMMMFDAAAARYYCGDASMNANNMYTADDVSDITYKRPHVVYQSHFFKTVYVQADSTKYGKGKALYITPMFWVTDPNLLPAVAALRHDP